MVAVGDIWTSIVLGEDGRVYVWGQNNFGFLGGLGRLTDRTGTALAALTKPSGRFMLWT